MTPGGLDHRGPVRYGSPMDESRPAGPAEQAAPAAREEAAEPSSGPAAAPPFLRVRWQWSGFASLRPSELYAALALRGAAFVVEQECAFLDPDGLDADAFHLLGWTTPGGASPAALVGYLRVLAPGSKYPEPSIGRVITASTHRRIGLGRMLMIEGITRTRTAFPGRPIRIGAQQRLHRLYESLGFHQASAPYQEDGIPHIEMLLE